MKKIIITIIITFTITSLFWFVVMKLRRGIDELWLISAVKVPTRMALNIIQAELDGNEIDLAKKHFKIVRKQWNTFDTESGLMTNAMGDIMVVLFKDDQKSEQNGCRNAPRPTP